jgi:TATA-box binding protein (TBP) (component of TFIID and TFIIIB)
VTIGYADAYSRKSIKLFPNGSIQVAGCSNLYDCKRILHQLTLIVKDTLGIEELEAKPPQISMINTNFSLNTSVNLHKVIGVLSRVQGFKVTYDPDRYSAVKVKFSPGPGMKQVTASIFKTGKIIVTGAQQLSEIVAAYDLLNQHITKDTFIENVEKPELFDTIMGAKFVEWVQQIKLRA